LKKSTSSPSRTVYAADVDIAYTGGKSRDPDFVVARDAYREKIGDPTWKKPQDYLWHHHEQVGRMILIKREIHEAFQHTGGIPLYRILVGDLSAYRQGER
jgi:hypothetical protein